MTSDTPGAPTAADIPDVEALFDAGYYRRNAPPLAPDESPLDHYLRAGANLGLDPHPLFWTDYYRQRYGADLAGQNPLVHFLTEGWKLGYDPNPFFSTLHYQAASPDVEEHGSNPAVHYALHGGNEWERVPHPGFSPIAYAQRRRLKAGTNPLVDFLERLLALRAERAHHHVSCDPQYSVVILNFNKALLTLQCVLEVCQTRDVGAIEIIVVDNGSHTDDIRMLATWLPRGVQIVRLSRNRYFGEGNNIGVNASRGRFVLFLNNDAFLEPGTLRGLTDVLDRYPDAGAAGPKFLYPNGTIQEAGGFVSSCGIITQRGKFLANIDGRYERDEPVDYVSAACLLVPRRYVDAVRGFDLGYEPAYYEDVDFCYKLRLFGLRTYYCGSTSVVHIENATSGDSSLGLHLNDIVSINREKFIARWSTYIETGDVREMSQAAPDPARTLTSVADRPLAVIMTPYHLIPGGGERYILTIAETLSRRYRTMVVTPERYSSYRFSQLGQELDLDLSNIEHFTTKNVAEYRNCDLYLSIGNEVLPHSRGIGTHNLYICQFPFPMESGHVANAWTDLDTYDGVVVYSEFAARCFAERSAALLNEVPPVHVLAPAVPMYESSRTRKPGRIINVGRFASEGHCKRQDSLVQAFRQLVERNAGGEELELHLVGTVPPDRSARDYFTDVSRRAAGARVFFHLNAGAQTVRELYESASFYWHATGLGRSERINPELMEHFGITVVEAMSAGAIPLVYAAGGPAEIVEDGATGVHWRTLDELIVRTESLLADSATASRMRRSGTLAAHRFDRSSFDRRFTQLIDALPRARPIETAQRVPSTRFEGAALGR